MKRAWAGEEAWPNQPVKKRGVQSNQWKRVVLLFWWRKKWVFCLLVCRMEISQFPTTAMNYVWFMKENWEPWYERWSHLVGRLEKKIHWHDDCPTPLSHNGNYNPYHSKIGEKKKSVLKIRLIKYDTKQKKTQPRE